MLRRAILGSSAALAAFVLVLTGAVFGARNAPPALTSQNGTVPVEVVLAREAALRRLLEDATARPPAPTGFQTTSAEVAVTQDDEHVEEHHGGKHHGGKHHSDKHHHEDHDD
ncbi:MAG: hypothetical protein JNL79_26370 [Myxococcales bacterium]|nr:hypothetical protein [Myxococcales bacterium]